MNTTIASTNSSTYWGSFDNISKYSSELNIFERLWAAWYAYLENDALATGIMSFALHEIVYICFCIPWIIIDAIPYFIKYKIQKNHLPTMKEHWITAKYILLTNIFIELPQIWLFHPLANLIGIDIGVPFPSLWTMTVQIMVFFVIEDTWHYWAHRALHWGPLYRNVHKFHHQPPAPFGLAAAYASPIDIAVLGLGTIGSPLIWAAYTGRFHLITMYIWVTLRLLQAIDNHSGYDFPWSLHNFLPFYTGADHHDKHHQVFLGNYASSFRWWDYLMNTEIVDGVFTKQKVLAKTPTWKIE